MFESQNPNSDAAKQAYLRDAANYMFDKHGEAALDRLTQDFDACMKEFHEHRLEVLRKLQTPEGVAMIREMTYAKIKEQQMEGGYIIKDLYTSQYIRDLNGLEILAHNLEWTPDKLKARRFRSKADVRRFQEQFHLLGWTARLEYLKENV